MNKISIREIEVLFKLIIEKLKKDNIDQVEFSTDEYWVILTNEWENFQITPEPAVGSLSEDIEYLKKAIEENEVVTYSDLDRLASVLRAISEFNAPSK
jgi:hypothetical protein